MSASGHIPTNNGKWSGFPGNSVWFPDLDCRPLGANDPYKPYKFKQLVLLNLKKSLNLPGVSPIKIMSLKTNLFRFSCGLMGVHFYNGEPDFSPFAIATVKVDKYMDVRYGSNGTMPQADKLLAKRLGITEKEVRQWINDNQYVWHERQDGKKIDLLCHDIHGNIPHRGGISKNKERNGR
jgi:hypothetical protein